MADLEEELQSFTSDDGLVLKYLDTANLKTSTSQDGKKPYLILIHGFSGSHLAWKRNIPSLSRQYRIIAPDLRGHGSSQTPPKSPSGSYDVKYVGVERLARDLRNLIEVLAKNDGKEVEEWRGVALGGSLGCAVIWSYAHLYTPQNFTHTIFTDQSPLQNQIPGSWDPPYCHKGLRTQSDFDTFSHILLTNPEKAHLGTIHSCLGYLSHPSFHVGSEEEKRIEKERYEDDREFFLKEAMRCGGGFLVELMRDHTALDHRENIKRAFGRGSKSETRVLVVGSKRSGCFDEEGVLSVVGFVNGVSKDEEGREGETGENGSEKGGERMLARGVAVEWGGHWCYWEDAEKFNAMILKFLEK